ncbi:DinB family protein [Mucilaginibacter sp. dw_454]|uniref:DinB family protein n=1 Tax=Mucilaginibacter sp. dw_454 TaxID=2720079 RepID=UPI001BD5EAF0|nr:DinB family protein [Mucilaginibacter sp. dw_454]
MTTNEKLQQELEKVLSGQPWYGEPVYNILDKITFESAYERAGHAHTIAEIVMHLVSWTEEVMDRLNEKPASMPVSGNWPDPGAPDEQKWKLWIEDFKLVNVNLVKTIQDFPDAQWDEPIIDERGTKPVTTYKETVEGLIQHHIYHTAQIAVLLRVIIG